MLGRVGVGKVVTDDGDMNSRYEFIQRLIIFLGSPLDDALYNGSHSSRCTIRSYLVYSLCEFKVICPFRLRSIVMRLHIQSSRNLGSVCPRPLKPNDYRTLVLQCRCIGRTWPPGWEGSDA